jgi:hypothetical protein
MLKKKIAARPPYRLEEDALGAVEVVHQLDRVFGSDRCLAPNHNDVIFDRHAEVSEVSLEGCAVYPSSLGAFAPKLEMTVTR